jgi:soluble lytic murein transglycosylase-like protein
MVVASHQKFDYRVICPCQMHARRKRARKIAAAAMTHIRRRGVALIVGVPLAFGALGFPTEAMNIALPVLGNTTVEVPQANFHVFTTRKIREAFMHPENAPRQLTLDVMKEDFFRTEIPYGAIIYREATRNDLSPELVAAIIESESDFRPRLVSNKNAQGLMQLVPETGRLLGCENLFNPSQNIAAGTKYLRYLLDRFGDQRTALAAYNAGEGNVERFGGVPPFTETINYLQRVSYRTRLYRQRVHNRYLAAVRMRGAVVE